MLMSICSTLVGHFVRISQEELICIHTDAVRAILLAPLTKGDWYKALGFDKNHPTSMSEIDPRRKNEMKKIFAPGYLSSNVLRSEASLDECLDSLQTHLARHAENNKPIHLDQYFYYWSFDSAGKIVFSKTFGFLDAARDIGGSIANIRFFAHYVSITGHANWIHDVLFGNPLLRYFGFKPKQHIIDTAEAGAEARRRNPEAGQDMIEQWGLALRKNKIANFKDEDLVQNAASTVTAGAETTSTTLQSFVYFLLRYPNVHAQVVVEVDAARAAGQLSDTIQASEAQSLPYLQAVLKECLRFFPPAPSCLPRKAPAAGLRIGDRQFPAGTTLSVNPHIIHRNQECFGLTANDFVPERWLGEEGKALEKYFLPFGQGYNSCPGRPIAFIQLSKAAAMLTRDFEFRQVDEGKPWKYENWFTVVPYGWPCYVKKRDWRERSGERGE